MKKLFLLSLALLIFVSLEAQNYEEFKKQRERGLDSLEQQAEKFKKDRDAEYEKFKKEYNDEFEKYKKNYDDFLSGEISVIELMASDDNIKNKKLDKKFKPSTTQSTASKEVARIEKERASVSKMTGEEFLSVLSKSDDKVKRVQEGLSAIKQLNSSFEVTSQGADSPGIEKKEVDAKKKPDVKSVKYDEQIESDENKVTEERAKSEVKEEVKSEVKEEVKGEVEEKMALPESVPGGKPTDYNRISSRFGTRIHPITHRKSNHKGVDLSAPNMTAIYATADGTITVADFRCGYGNFVKINHENGYKTAYAHLQKIATENFQKVRKGDLIGYVGSTGQSTGNHLHYEIYYLDGLVDPEPTLSK